MPAMRTRLNADKLKLEQLRDEVNKFDQAAFEELHGAGCEAVACTQEPGGVLFHPCRVVVCGAGATWYASARH